MESSFKGAPSSHWNVSSDPPDETYAETVDGDGAVGHGMETPTKDDSSDRREDESVSGEIISHRKGYYRDMFPSYSSSPTHSNRRMQNEKDKKLGQAKASKRDKNALKIRGGLENMENFVMKSELLEVQRIQQLQALEHEIPDELIEKLEQERNEDLEDDELIELINRRDCWEKELNQILSELIID